MLDQGPQASRKGAVVDTVGPKHAEVVAALQRAVAADASPRVSAGHVLQLIGTAMVGIALVFSSALVGIVLGVTGAIAMAVALRLTPGASVPTTDLHTDAGTGFPTASALPIVLRDDRVITTLTGRLSVLILDVQSAAACHDEGDRAAGEAVLRTVLHRLETHTWAYPIGDSFGPLLFRDGPSTIVVVRRDVLGEQSNEWFAERLLDAIAEPIPWADRSIDPAIAIGGATGPANEGPAIAALATMTRRDARATGRTVTIRRLHRRRSEPSPPIEVAAAGHHGSVGVFFAPADLGSRVGIFEHLAALRSTFSHALGMVQESGVRPLVATSVIALSHPAAASDLIHRASDAGMAGRVGIVLPPDFPVDPGHRAAETVAQLARAGFLIVIDRRDSADYLISLPHCPIDLVMVDLDFNELGGGSPAERALLDAADARHAGLAHARMSVRAGAPEPVPVPATTSLPAPERHLLRQGMNGPGHGGRLAHLAKAGATSGR